VAFSELLDVSADLRASLGRHFPSFEFLLDDISAVEDEELRGRAITTLARIALFCLARARTSSDFSSELRRWNDALSELVGLERVAALSMVVIIFSPMRRPSTCANLNQLGRKPRRTRVSKCGGKTSRRVAGGSACGVFSTVPGVKFGSFRERFEQRVRSAGSPSSSFGWARARCRRSTRYFPGLKVKHRDCRARDHRDG
jgi:hypothetical protein